MSLYPIEQTPPVGTPPLDPSTMDVSEAPSQQSDPSPLAVIVLRIKQFLRWLKDEIIGWTTGGGLSGF